MRRVSFISDQNTPFTDKPHLQKGRQGIHEDRGWRTEDALHRRCSSGCALHVGEDGATERGVDVLMDTYAEENLSDEPYEREQVQVLRSSRRAPRITTEKSVQEMEAIFK